MRVLKIFSSCLFLLSFLMAFPYFLKAQSAQLDMEKLVNYKKMDTKMHQIYLKQRQAQIESWEKNQIPKAYRIPPELQSYRTDNATRFYVIYSPLHKTGVGYVPSNLARLYEEEAWRASKEFGSSAPSLSIVLAQQFTESAFNPYAIGDKGQSVGLPQLYRKTAKILYKTDQATWKELFYFDKKGHQIFKSFRTQIRFPFMFLPIVKQYRADNKLDGLKRYNGTGPEAIEYAETIMKRSLFYEELFSQYNAIPLDTTSFKQNLFGMINLTLECREAEVLTDEKLEELFSNVMADFSSGYVYDTYHHNLVVSGFEDKPIQITQPSEFIMPADGKDYYLIVEDGKYIYDYFKDSQTLLTVLNNPKNKGYYLYYKSGKKQVKITSYKGVGNKPVFSNVKAGDKIYIPPGTVIFSNKANVAVMMK